MSGCITISLCSKLRELLHRLIAPRSAYQASLQCDAATIHICFNDGTHTYKHIYVQRYLFSSGHRCKRNFYDESKTKRSINHVRAILPLFGFVPESRKVCNKLSRLPSSPQRVHAIYIFHSFFSLFLFKISFSFFLFFSFLANLSLFFHDSFKYFIVLFFSPSELP